MSNSRMSEFQKEADMLWPLLKFLYRLGRVNDDTLLSTEFPWFGRRVDLAVLTKTRRTAAYELKLSDNFAAVDQASRNALAFDRSYAVIATFPSRNVLDFAQMMGVGIFQLRVGSLKLVLRPSLVGPVEPELRRRLIARLRRKANSSSEVAYV